MYVEKDQQGRIIIQDISENEAEILDDCFCSYLSGTSRNQRTDADKMITKLKRELEKLY